MNGGKFGISALPMYGDAFSKWFTDSRPIGNSHNGAGRGIGLTSMAKPTSEQIRRIVEKLLSIDNHGRISVSGA
jgi:hypothetical protein